jgi:CheY-like chemotaxis protein
VVLMDLEMPILDGYEATRRIKTEQPTLRVIILSVHAGLEEVQRARASGADNFVVKGSDYQLLLNAILATDGSPNVFDQN